MDVNSIKNWLTVKLSLEEETEEAKATLDYVCAIDDIVTEIEDQIEWSNSDVVKATLKHVRDNIIGKYLKK